MATPPQRTPLTPEEYLAIERRAEGRHEFYRGEMFAMGGASYEHTLIVGNLVAALHGRLRGGPCRVLPQDQRVLVKAAGLYTYPDLVVVCGDRQFQENAFDTLTNPTVLVEVLSPSTEAYDRGWKFDQYREIPSLREYLIVAQDRRAVDLYRREADHWTLRHASRPEEVIVLDSIGCELPLALIYEEVEFPPEPPRPHLANPGPPRA